MTLTNYYRLVKTTNTTIYKRQGKDVERPVMEKVYISSKELDNISLETGDLLPDLQGHKTIIPNYFFDFWTPILGMGAAFTYVRYVRQAYGDSDIKYSINKMAQMMGISANTLRSYLDKLEEYGFICRFYQNVILEDGKIDENQIETTIKVRKTVPIVPNSLLEKLPNIVQKEHEAYLKRVLKTQSVIDSKNVKSANEVLGINPTKESTPTQNLSTPPYSKSEYPPTQELSTHLLKNSVPPYSNIEYPPTQNLSAFQEPQIKQIPKIKDNNDLNNNKDDWEMICEILKKEMSVISFSSWIEPLQTEIKNNSLIIKCNNSFCFSWINQKYLPHIKETVKKVNPKIQSIIVSEIADTPHV